MKLCQKYHVHILSIHDGYFDMDKAFDRLKLNIFISLAELESDNIGEQVKNGLKEKAKQGKLITTHASFGYHYQMVLSSLIMMNHLPSKLYSIIIFKAMVIRKSRNT